MKHLVLKKEFNGMVISKLYPGIGNITFDPSKVSSEQYENYSKYGFDHMFDVIDSCDNCLELICVCKTELPKEKGEVVIKKMNTKNVKKS